MTNIGGHSTFAATHAIVGDMVTRLIPQVPDSGHRLSCRAIDPTSADAYNSAVT